MIDHPIFFAYCIILVGGIMHYIFNVDTQTSNLLLTSVFLGGILWVILLIIGNIIHKARKLSGD